MDGSPNESRSSNEVDPSVSDRKADDRFRPAWWLSNCHLQTIWPVLCRAHIRLKARRERVELPDGDFLDVDWVGRGGPIVIVLHGLQGAVESNYARGLLREIEARGLFLPVVSAAVRYKRPARYDDLITVRTRIVGVKGARLNFSYEIVNEKGQLLVEGETQHANTGPGGKPTPTR